MAGSHSSPPDVAPPDVPDVLDSRYQLEERLKKGSTGAIFIGKDLRLGIAVAVKVLRSSQLVQRQASTARRMLQEAHIAAQLSHPALVQMLDMGTAPNGAPYLVMELLRGDSLATLIAGRERLEPVEAVQILLPVAEGLAWAHQHKVVHRNVKPENVWLARKPEGGVQPKLIDFGLAKAELESTDRITQRGEALGTPEYMAPEQARGEDVTASADLWAFCVMLYKLVAGEAPFRGRSHTDVLESILHDDPKPLMDLGRGDERLWAILARGLAKDPSARWATVSDLGTALAGWLLDRGESCDACGEALSSRWPEVSTGAHSVPPGSTEPRRTGSDAGEPAAERPPSLRPPEARDADAVASPAAAPHRLVDARLVVALLVAIVVVAAFWYWRVH